MPEDKSIKLFTAAKELNIGTGTIVDFLATKGYKVQKHPTTLLDGDMYGALLKEFAVDKIIKEEAKQISIGKIRKEEPAPFPEKPVEHRRSRDFAVWIPPVGSGDRRSIYLRGREGTLSQTDRSSRGRSFIDRSRWTGAIRAI